MPVFGSQGFPVPSSTATPFGGFGATAPAPPEAAPRDDGCCPARHQLQPYLSAFEYPQQDRVQTKCKQCRQDLGATVFFACRRCSFELCSACGIAELPAEHPLRADPDGHHLTELKSILPLIGANPKPAQTAEQHFRRAQPLQQRSGFSHGPFMMAAPAGDQLWRDISAEDLALYEAIHEADCARVDRELAVLDSREINSVQRSQIREAVRETIEGLDLETASVTTHHSPAALMAELECCPEARRDDGRRCKHQ